MNLLAHIITCSSPSMNLPAHGTTSPDPSIASLHKITHKQAIDNSVIAWRSLSVARQNLPRPPGGTCLTARRCNMPTEYYEFK